MNKLVLIGIFKNESHILEEWINHYIKMGVDKILLINNGSTDNFMDILDKYIKNDIVILKSNNKKNAQNYLYNKYFKVYCRQYAEWVLIADLDEFLYTRNGYNKLTDYLDTIKDKNISSIKVPWKIFGSNGHIDQPSSVIKEFTKRDIYISERMIQCKTFTRGNLIKWLDLHQSKVDNKYKMIMSNNIIDKCERNWVIISEDILLDSNIHLNHYITQSFNWFMKVKVPRGSAANVKHNNLRDENYFKSHDFNNIEDYELSELY